MPHSPTHREPQSTPNPRTTPGPSPSPGETEQVEVGGGVVDVGLDDNRGEGTTYRDMSKAWLSEFLGGNYQVGLTPISSLQGPFGAVRSMTRHLPSSMRGQPDYSRRDSIALLQNRLIGAGLLDPENITHFGALDPNTLNRIDDLMMLQDVYGFESPEETLQALEKGFIGWDAMKEEERKFTPRPFEKPPLEKMAQEDLEQAIEASFTSVLGRRPKDEELHRFASEFRSRQAKAHEQEVGVAREIHEAREGFRRTKFEGGGGGERTIELGPIEEEPNPRNLTTERLVDTDEAKAFHGARLGLDLLSALKGGF